MSDFVEVLLIFYELFNVLGLIVGMMLVFENYDEINWKVVWVWPDYVDGKLRGKVNDLGYLIAQVAVILLLLPSIIFSAILVGIKWFAEAFGRCYLYVFRKKDSDEK